MQYSDPACTYTLLRWASVAVNGDLSQVEGRITGPPHALAIEHS